MEKNDKPKPVCKECMSQSAPVFDEIGDLSAFGKKKDKPAQGTKESEQK